MNKELKEYTSAELFKLAEQKAEEEKRLARPKPLLDKQDPLHNELMLLSESYLDDAERGREIDTYHAYELLMGLVYSDRVWDYINNL